MSPFWKNFFLDNVAPKKQPTKQQLQKELTRLKAQLFNKRIIFNGCYNFVMDSSKAVTVHDYAQFEAAKNNVQTYEKLIAQTEIQLLSLEPFNLN